MINTKKYYKIFSMLLFLALLLGQNISVFADTPDESGTPFIEKPIITIEEGTPIPRSIAYFYFKGASGKIHGIPKTNYYGKGFITNANGVKIIQAAVTACGYSTNGLDGIYGTNTTNAVIRFQSKNSLNPDGICGPSTLAVLESKIGSSTGARIAGL